MRRGAANWVHREPIVIEVNLSLFRIRREVSALGEGEEAGEAKKNARQAHTWRRVRNGCGKV
jgi:hypothetical protein